MNSRLLIILISLLVFTLSCSDGTIIELTSPDGGETWHEQTTQKIKWETGFSVSQVDIYYSLDGGDTWYEIDSYNSSNEYIWETPSVNSDYESCLVKIYETDDETNYDMSSNFFSIIADSAYYSVTSPNGGETWEELSTQTITWKSGGNVESSNYYVSLYYSLDGGAGWIEIENSEVNDGSYSWIIPEVYVTNAACRIKVKQKYSPYIEDISDADFTITAGSGQSDIINVISANGGEVWHEQTSEEITWYTTGDIGGNEVYVGYSTDGGNYWYDAVGGGAGTTDPPHTSYWDETSNSGSYSWSLPNFSDTLETCIVGVWSAANTALYDMSDNYFTITCDSNYYRILQPNGGETFQKETDRYILWESDGDVDNIEIYYSLFGGESWYLIENNTANDGSFIWSVPSVQGTNDACKIKIQSRDRDDWFDISDGNFTIADTAIFEIDMDFEIGEDFSNWTYSGNWTDNSGDSYSGDRSAFCFGNTNASVNPSGEEYVMSTVATVNSGVLRFFYKTEFHSNNSGSYLKLLVDGVTAFIEYDDESTWALGEVYLQGGSHTFQWVWRANGGGDNSCQTRIDAISFP